ncbi:erythromycin esterase family protein [Nocardia puris]|uniref:erythromycin esterase family protein n=1 Tax=Nocardia puris TaxID=208602 RepID=UPI002B4B5F51|nr:erythromycin esterase family protein [Nocardia puris]
MTTPAVRAWLRANAVPLVDDGPVPAFDGARIVGIGESTRFSRQITGLRQRWTRDLIEHHGFRALGLQDSARAGARLDAYVRAGVGDPVSVLDGAWAPWRTTETAEALRWLREFNTRHPDDMVTVFGVEPPAAEPSDYDLVRDHVYAVAPDRLPELEAHLTPIRTAHRIGEHVQRHQGIHPGRPFVEDAADALALVEALPDAPGTAEALAAMRSIHHFHATSVAAGGAQANEHASAESIADHAASAKVVYWDGIAHTSALPLGVGSAVFRGAGSHLRERFGAAYASVGIGFHHGDLGVAVAPPPGPDLLESALGEFGLSAFSVDLRAGGLDAPARMRVISGVYDPERDEDATAEVPSLSGAFDVIAHIRETAPVDWLPEPVSARGQ